MHPAQVQELIALILSELWLDVAVLAFVGGALGSVCSNALFGFIDRRIEAAQQKRRAAAWKSRQAKAKAEQGAQPRGDDEAGLACETRSGGAA